MKKKNSNILIIIIVLIVIAILFYLSKPVNFISVRYYDINGDLINNYFSTVVPSTVYYFDMTIKVSNDGTQNLNCRPTNLNPTELDNTMNKDYKLVRTNQVIEWTSSKMLVSDFVGRLNPQRFNVTVECSYDTYIRGDKTGSILINRSGFIDLEIKNVCGDNICQSGETNSNCAIDCSFPTNAYVNFRTSRIDYSYSANSYPTIAFNLGTCGNDLTKFYYYGGSYLYGNNTSFPLSKCTDIMPIVNSGSSNNNYRSISTNCGANSHKVMDVPGGKYTGVEQTSLWHSNESGFETRYCICSSNSLGKYTFQAFDLYNYYNIQYYDSIILSSQFNLGQGKEAFC